MLIVALIGVRNQWGAARDIQARWLAELARNMLANHELEVAISKLRKAWRP